MHSYSHMKPIIINNSFQPQVLSCSLLQISLKTFCFQCRKLSEAQCLLKTSPPSPKAKQSIRLSPVQFPQNISSFAPYIHLLIIKYWNTKMDPLPDGGSPFNFRPLIFLGAQYYQPLSSLSQPCQLLNSHVFSMFKSNQISPSEQFIN